MKTWAVVRTQKVGYHQWPGAPVIVHFLRHLHRHVFYYEVWIEQFHDDRDIEYTLFKTGIEEMLDQIDKDLGLSRSCEMIAKALIGNLKAEYRGRSLKVHVFEDNENGAVVEYDSSEAFDTG